MKTFEQYCAEQGHTLGAPVEDVSPTICRLANEYGDYMANSMGLKALNIKSVRLPADEEKILHDNSLNLYER